MITLGLTAPSPDQDHLRAHGHCTRNRSELKDSPLCGCFYCFAIYPPSEISGWVDDEQTAICARCGIDSVIASAAGYPLTEEFLHLMHHHWFWSRQHPDAAAPIPASNPCAL